MKMDAQEEAMGSKEYTHIVKGKRTKRPRPSSPLALTMTCSATTTSISSSTIPQLSNSSSIAGGVSDNNSGGPSLDPTDSVQFTQTIITTDEEEEDMANCLILLAQGQTPKPSEPEVVPTTTTTTHKATGALYLYQCKTCNRCFPSFQALGGHRASHKKHNKATGEEQKPLALTMQEEEEDQNNNIYSTTLSLQICNRVLSSSSSNNKSRVHECSICGAEFMSGQALGGHMRRHRSMMPPLMGLRTSSSSISPAAESSSWSQLAAAKKPRSSSVLSLDLNLPAPEVDNNDHREYSNSIPNFTSPSPLVDCHY